MCERRGIAGPGVTAFGDAPDDLEMVRWAGTRYAAANAHSRVLAPVAQHAAANDVDGVAVVLEGLLAADRCSRSG